MDINKEQQHAIDTEVLAKKARDKAIEIIEHRRPLTRARIEDILDKQKLSLELL